MQRCPEIEELVRRFVDAKRRGDGESVVAMLARQPDISWIGAESEDWVTDRVRVAFPDEEVGEIRFTAVAILEEGEWRFVQGQVSVPETQFPETQ